MPTAPGGGASVGRWVGESVSRWGGDQQVFARSGEDEDGWGFMVRPARGRMAGVRPVLGLNSESWSDERSAEVSDEGAGFERLKTTDRSVSR
jgi:hypothetical protein